MGGTTPGTSVITGGVGVGVGPGVGVGVGPGVGVGVGVGVGPGGGGGGGVTAEIVPVVLFSPVPQQGVAKAKSLAFAPPRV